MNDELFPELASAAKTMSASGASKGGKARANTMTPEERSEVARNAVRARWAKAGKLKPQPAEPADPPEEIQPAKTTQPDGEPMPFSMFRGILEMGNLKLECHVLNDGRRVFTQREIVRVLSGGGRESGGLSRYLDNIPLNSNHLSAVPTIEFKIPGTGNNAVGREATFLIELCDLYLEALPKLKKNQKPLAVIASTIIRSCAKVGIIALIDEVTGYQEFREKRSLQIKLQAFIADDLQEWARMFKPEFWFELARLEGIHYSPRNRPLRWGKYIMAFVYDAIDKDVGKELRDKNPNPHFKKNHHQWLKEFGREKVHDHVERVITVMKMCDNMEDFRKKFARVFKKTPLQTSFDDINWTMGGNGAVSVPRA
jgi:hypothetical protein